jgi:hypothetical protein
VPGFDFHHGWSGINLFSSAILCTSRVVNCIWSFTVYVNDCNLTVSFSRVSCLITSSPSQRPVISLLCLATCRWSKLPTSLHQQAPGPSDSSYPAITIIKRLPASYNTTLAFRHWPPFDITAIIRTSIQSSNKRSPNITSRTRSRRALGRFQHGPHNPHLLQNHASVTHLAGPFAVRSA